MYTVPLCVLCILQCYSKRGLKQSEGECVYSVFVYVCISSTVYMTIVLCYKERVNVRRHNTDDISSIVVAVYILYRFTLISSSYCVLLNTT